MRTVVSSSLFGFVALSAFALAGCSFSTEAEGPAGSMAEDRGSSASESNGIAKPELGPPSLGAGRETVSGMAPAEVGPVAPNAAELVKVELSAPERELLDGKPAVPTAIGIAPPKLGPVANISVAPAGCTSDAECGTPECYNGVQEAFFCDITGSCQVQIDSCGAFACGGAACLTQCQSDTDCAEGASCVDGRCKES